MEENFSKKLFLLEFNLTLREQIADYLKNCYQIQTEVFSSAEQLIRASISHYPKIIIFEINSQSQRFLPKLKAFKNSFGTKIVVVISHKDKKNTQNLEIADYILYKPFTFQDLDFCLANFMVAKNPKNEYEKIKQQQLEKINEMDLIEKDSLIVEYRKTFKNNSNVTLEDVKQELYDDILVLDQDIESNPAEIPTQHLHDRENRKFDSEIKTVRKGLNIIEKIPEDLYKNYFYKIDPETIQLDNLKNKTFAEAKTEEIGTFDFASLNKELQKTNPAIKPPQTKKPSVSPQSKPEDNLMSISDFNLNFLDKE